MNLLNTWQQGDAIVNLVLIILIIMSVLSWYVIFYKALKLRKEYKFYKNFCTKIVNQKENLLFFTSQQLPKPYGVSKKYTEV